MRQRAQCFVFVIPRPSTSPLRLFQGGEKVPQLAMGLFRRPVKCRRWGHCEQCAKRFLFGTLLRGPQPATLVLAQSLAFIRFSVDPLFRSAWKPGVPSSCRRPILPTLPSALYVSCFELRDILGSVKIGAAISKSVSGFPAGATVAVTK